jgi:type VI secretion system secreted protein Hcp
MAGDIFLDLEGVKGESEKKEFEKKIEVETVSWGGSNPTSFVHGGGGGVGKVHLQDVHFTKTVDASSGTLYKFCCNGKHIPKAKFTFRKAGEEARKYFELTLEDVMIASFSLQDHSGGGSLAHESISLSYAKITGKYFPQKKDGTLDAEVPFGWDVKKHEPAQ